MTEAPEVTRILRPSPLRCIGLSVSCAVMAVVLFYLWFNGTENAWIAGSFMAAGAVFFGFHMVPDSYALWLDRQGFRVSEMFTIKRYEWSDVSDFTVRRGILGHYVEFYHDTSEEERPRRAVLNETYGFKPVEMAKLLNEHRKHAMQKPEKDSRGNVWGSRKS